jgi:hypothetical protein
MVYAHLLFKASKLPEGGPPTPYGYTGDQMSSQNTTSLSKTPRNVDESPRSLRKEPRFTGVVHHFHQEAIMQTRKHERHRLPPPVNRPASIISYRVRAVRRSPVSSSQIRRQTTPSTARERGPAPSLCPEPETHSDGSSGRGDETASHVVTPCQPYTT